MNRNFKYVLNQTGRGLAFLGATVALTALALVLALGPVLLALFFSPWFLVVWVPIVVLIAYAVGGDLQ